MWFRRKNDTLGVPVRLAALESQMSHVLKTLNRLTSSDGYRGYVNRRVEKTERQVESMLIVLRQIDSHADEVDRRNNTEQRICRLERESGIQTCLSEPEGE